MPVKLGRFEGKVILCRHASTVAACLPPDDQDHQSTKGDVQSMESCGGKKGARVQVVGQTKGEGEVFDHLTDQKGQSQPCGDQQPVAATALKVLADGLPSLVKCGTAHQQQHRVEDGQRQLELVDGSLRQGVDGLEGEVGREKAGEGHRISNEKGGQAEHAVVSVLLVPVGVDGR